MSQLLWKKQEDCGFEMFEMSKVEHMKTRKGVR
jgi:hypothetical protein